MALIKCSDCGKKISDSVSSCPNCGNNIKKQLKKEKELKNQELLTTILCTKCYKRVNKYASKCPYCGDDLSEAKAVDKQSNIIAFIILGVIAIGIVWFIVAGCSSDNDNEYGEEEYKCAMKSSATRTCSYSVYSNKCVCKTKK